MSTLEYATTFASIYLSTAFHESDFDVGIIMTMFSISFLIMNIVTLVWLRHAVPRRVLCAIALLINGIACCLRSGSPQYGIPDTVPFLVFAGCLSSGAAGIDVPLETSEGIESFKLENNHVDGLDLRVDNAIADCFAVLQTCATNVIFLAAIQIGASLYSHFGYQ